MSKAKGAAPDEIEVTRAATRELHEALAEAKQVLRELHNATQSLKHQIDQLAQTRIEETVSPVVTRIETQFLEIKESVDRAEGALWEQAAGLVGAKSPEDFIALVTDRVAFLLKQSADTQIRELTQELFADRAKKGVPLNRE